MYKADVLAKFSKEIQDLAQRGLYTLFESKVDKSLLAKTSSGDCFKFDIQGNFNSTITSSSIDFSKFEKLELMSGDQILNILRAANSSEGHLYNKGEAGT